MDSMQTKPHLMPEIVGVTTIHELADEGYQKDESDCECDANHLFSVHKPQAQRQPRKKKRGLKKKRALDAEAQTPARISASNALLNRKHLKKKYCVT